MAEDGGTEGPRHERDTVTRERQKRRRQRVGLRKEQFREDQRRRGPIDEMVVELQRRSDETRSSDLCNRLPGLRFHIG